MFGEWFKLDPPRYIDIFGFKVYWYGIIIATGFLLAVIYAMRRDKEFGLTDDNIIDLLIATVPAAIIGARLYYVVFEFDRFKADTAWQTFKNIINIRDGGLAIYGAVIFAIIAAVIFCKVKKIHIGDVLDIGSFGFLIGQCVAGR